MSVGAVSFSVGNNVKNVRGLKQITAPFSKFASAVLRESGKAKDGLYVCGPMAGGHRMTANVQPISYLAMDFDHLTKEQWQAVGRKSKQWSSFCYTTPSHNPTAGDYRLRVFIELSRAVNRDEYRTLYGVVAAELGVAGDMSGAKPEQAMYTRRAGTAGSLNLDKTALNVEVLLARIPVEDDPLGAVPAWITSKVPASIMAAGPTEFPPYWAEDVAEHCAQVRLMRDTKGDVSLDHWRGVIGIIKHSESGIGVAKQWTELRRATGHGQDDVDRDWATWKGKPATCEHFERVNPDGCAGCPHKGKINTPAVLGRREPSPVEPATVEAVTDEGRAVKVQIPTPPSGFAFDGHHMVRYRKDKDGIMEAHNFASMLFYAISWVKQIDRGGAMMMRQHFPGGRTREFIFECKDIGSMPALLSSLGANNIVATDNRGSQDHLKAYLTASLNKLLKESKEQEEMGAFGWKQDMKSFLIGDRLYTADGGMTLALVGGTANNYKKTFAKITGTAQGWSEAIDLLYNREGMQHMQYALCSAFGSLLSPLAESLYKGIPCAITGEDSGKGKSAVCKAALYAFGDAELMTINGERGTTGNNLYTQMSVYNNIPLLWDEVTNCKPDALSQVLYTLSGGRDKGRLMSGKTGGVKPQDVGEWRMSPYLTANAKLSNTLASKQGNTEAEAVRLFEISIDVYGVQMAELGEAEAAFAKIGRNMGGAGEEYIKHLVTNFPATEAAYMLMSKSVGEAAETARVSQYRFFRQHVICTLTAAQIMKDLGLVQFDMAALRGWALKHLEQLCQDVKANNVTATTDALGQMLTALSPFIIQTKELRDMRTSKYGPEDVSKPNGPVVGRVVRDTGRLYISQAAAKNWCGVNRQNIVRILEQATKDKVYLGDANKFDLTKGTNLTAGRIPVFEFNWDMLDMGDQE